MLQTLQICGSEMSGLFEMGCLAQLKHLRVFTMQIICHSHGSVQVSFNTPKK